MILQIMNLMNPREISTTEKTDMTGNTIFIDQT